MLDAPAGQELIRRDLLRGLHLEGRAVERVLLELQILVILGFGVGVVGVARPRFGHAKAEARARVGMVAAIGPLGPQWNEAAGERVLDPDGRLSRRDGAWGDVLVVAGDRM